MSQHPVCRSSSSCLSITDRKEPDNLNPTFRGCWGGRQLTPAHSRQGEEELPELSAPGAGTLWRISAFTPCFWDVPHLSLSALGLVLANASPWQPITHLLMGQEPRAYLPGPGSRSWRRTLGPPAPAGGGRQSLAVETMDSCRTGAPWTF